MFIPMFDTDMSSVWHGWFEPRHANPMFTFFVRLLYIYSWLYLSIHKNENICCNLTWVCIFCNLLVYGLGHCAIVVFHFKFGHYIGTRWTIHEITLLSGLQPNIIEINKLKTNSHIKLGASTGITSFSYFVHHIITYVHILYFCVSGNPYIEPTTHGFL
jgi:hypothetical protein